MLEQSSQEGLGMSLAKVFPAEAVVSPGTQRWLFRGWQQDTVARGQAREKREVWLLMPSQIVQALSPQGTWSREGRGRWGGPYGGPCRPCRGV